MHLLIIDGLNLIRRIHAVIPGDGQVAVTTSIERCVSSISRLLEQFQPSHAVLCFDGSELSWRHHEYPGYKAGRKPMPSELQQALPLFRQAFSQSGIASLAIPAVEADDLAATLIHKMLSAGGAVTLVSTDKGFSQLISETDKEQKLTLWNHFDREAVDVNSVSKKFSVKPWQLTDYWGLAGDTTNQIPGVKGVGAKTAATLISKFDSIEELYERLDEVESTRHQNLLKDSKDIALLSRRLATLNENLELGCSLKDFRCKTGSYPNN